MGAMKTPGVYIVEKSAFPNSVVEVATAVPAFIGYTQKADNGGKSLKNKPWRISSLAEYDQYFGGPPHPVFEIKEISAPSAEEEAGAEGGTEAEEGADTEGGGGAQTVPEADFTVGNKDYLIEQTKGKYLLYHSMLLFFQNGGGPCYIVSVGNYGESVEGDKLKKGVDQLIKEQEPTMVVIPEAVLLDVNNCISVQQHALQHCGGKMKNRFAILDIYDGFKDRKHPDGDCIKNFRGQLGINYLDYAAAYYPWVNTTIVQDKDLGYDNFDTGLLQQILRTDLDIPEDPGDDEGKRILAEKVANIADATLKEDEKALLNKTLVQISPAFRTIIKEAKERLNLLPPAAAMAGIYTMVDNSRGVWKAPANVSLSSVISPSVNISHDDQEDLNVDINGKSVNAIRTFIGKGTLVWGARTLDGNSLDWRYINVRRTMIMLEESIKFAAKAYVFEPNTANTWVTMKSMIGNFLSGIWKRGGLAGATPEDAFSVHVGLGETMTPEDILEGILRITVLVAIVRPAEFIEITFQQQMQKS